MATPFQREQIPILTHQEVNTLSYSFCMHRDMLRSEQDSAWTLPEAVQHTLAILHSPASILTASGFSCNEAPAVGLGYLSAPLQPCICPSQRGFPSPGCREHPRQLTERCPITTLTAQTPWPLLLHSHV